MIISGLLNVIYGVFNLLLSPINIPSLPEDIHTYISTLTSYIGTGIGIISNYTHLNYLLLLFGIIVSIDVGLWLYKLVMFFIKKLPMLGIE